jgi:hypothetical protein
VRHLILDNWVYSLCNRVDEYFNVIRYCPQLEILEISSFCGKCVESSKPILCALTRLRILRIENVDVFYGREKCEIFRVNAKILDLFESWPYIEEVTAPFQKDDESESEVNEVLCYFQRRGITVNGEARVNHRRI